MNEFVKDQIERYYNYKWWLHIIFDTDSKNYLRTPHITFNIEVLKNLKTIVETYAKNGYFRQRIKNNIYTLLMHARDYKEGDYKARVDLINEITTLLNRQSKDNFIDFYRQQLYTRTKDINFLFNKDEIIALNIEAVEQLIYDDFIIISTHQEEISEKVFEEEYLVQFKNQEEYYENIAILLEECPYLFKDETFYNRVMKVLNENSKKEHFEKLNNKYLKKINRQVKKIKL
ncbi:MAG: hypothetical protein IJY25_01420 [Bacilli bacterium]|nr:hypothetical protein [Bacilli bacterium]